jgi:hypothetical protein
LIKRGIKMPGTRFGNNDLVDKKRLTDLMEGGRIVDLQVKQNSEDGSWSISFRTLPRHQEEGMAAAEEQKNSIAPPSVEPAVTPKVEPLPLPVAAVNNVVVRVAMKSPEEMLKEKYPKGFLRNMKLA